MTAAGRATAAWSWWPTTELTNYWPSRRSAGAAGRCPVRDKGLSPAALDPWYSNSNVEVRLGYKYHSPFSIIAGWNGSDIRTLGEESILDFSSSWQVNETFGVRLQVNNLTNEPVRISRDNSEDRLGSYDVYGRRALLDFTFKF